MLYAFLQNLWPTKTELEFGTMIAVVCSCLNHLMGDYNDGFEVLIILMIADYITGVIKAAVNKDCKLSSTKGLVGIAKKLGMIIAIVIAFQIDRLDWITLGIDAPPYIRNAFVYFFICNETISVLENLGQIGVPIPQFLPKFLREYMDKISKEKMERRANSLLDLGDRKEDSSGK